jgi:polysaccharide biosynthesis protein PslH
MKLLVILSRVPYPLEKGDKLRAYYQIKELSKSHEVFLCCLSDEKVHPEAPKKLAEIAKNVSIIELRKWKVYINVLLSFLGRKPFQVAYFYQRSAHKKVKSIIQNFNPNHIYCQLIRTAEYAKDEHGIPKTLDYQDAFSKGMDRRAAQSFGLKRWFFKAESKRLLRYENIVFEYFDFKCIISKQDRDLIYHEKRKEIAIIPNGVDFEFFKPKLIDKKFDLCFVGNMSYAPNINSTIFLVKEVLPLLLKKNPGIHLLISGANPVDEILKLSSSNVTVRGWVDDIRDSYAESKIFVAPMFLGTGLQNKLLEAMAMKIPCVTSKLANNALGAIAGEHLLIAKTPEEYAIAIFDLLNNPEKAALISDNGRKFVESNYSWQKSTHLLEQLMAGKQ